MSSPPRRSTDRSDANAPIDFTPLVGLVTDVLEAVPLGSPATWRGITYRTVLAAVVRDRVENGTEDLEEGDVSSLSDFVRAAAAAVAGAPAEHRDDAYEIVLQGILADWVENWNVSGDDEDDEEEDEGRRRRSEMPPI